MPQLTKTAIYPRATGEVPQERRVRFRTLGGYPLSGAIESEADRFEAIIKETELSPTSMHQGRLIDVGDAEYMRRIALEAHC